MEIQENIDLAPYTTYKIGGPARFFAACKSDEDVLEALSWAKKKDIPYFILGGGSNVLVADSGYEGLVISLQNDSYEINDKTLNAGAGVLMSTLVEETTEAAMAGLEWAGGLPGQLGGAIRGNAGAFGGEMKDIIKSVRVITPKGKVKTFKNKKCDFAYRSSIFKQQPGHIILSAQIELKKGDRDALLERVAELVEHRRSRHPLDYGNCGSVFKRKSLDDIPKEVFERYPEIEGAIRNGQVATAFFIDQAGLKKKRIGGAEVSERHPNFIVNKTGTAKAEHVMMLASAVKSRVLHQFGVLIEEEIHYLH
ncbi:MAG: UDP-N-acetylmuramate dehydrogenase [Candidatus Spechtbacterales bacterium]|nr:UDP-N-acetylmuramate dehydrogenase [Candidatus Spechtbacterales bacterium]